MPEKIFEEIRAEDPPNLEKDKLQMKVLNQP